MMATYGEDAMAANDYFAEGLLSKLDLDDPIHAAFEAQAVSREVGFDFDSFQDVVPRALDEIRETKEAFEEEGPEGREHFGDELADIQFSLINLYRHAGVPAEDLPRAEGIVATAAVRPTEGVDTLGVVDGIGERIAAVAETERDNPDKFKAQLDDLFQSGMVEVAVLAHAHGFNPEELLRENVRKYLIRCEAMERLAQQDGKQWSDLYANGEIVAYWKKAKILLK